MKKYYALAILLLCVLLSACSKNSSDEPAPDLLVGRWKQDSWKDISYDANGAISKSDIRDTSTKDVYVTFFADGRWEQVTTDVTIRFTYTRSGDKLIYAIPQLNGPVQYHDFLIQELTTTTLITHFEETTASGRRIYDIVYKRP